MNTGLLKIIRKRTSPDKIRLNKKISVFLVCLMISTIFWFLKILTNNYSTVISYPVEYTNNPNNFVLLNRDFLPKYLSLSVESNGFELLKYKISNVKSLEIDLSQINASKKNKDELNRFYATSNSFNSIKSQLGTTVNLLKIQPDTLYFNYDRLSAKKLPVKAKYNITLKQNYRLSDNILLDPDSIVVTGSTSIIDTLLEISTELIKLENIEKTLSVNSKLRNDYNKNVIWFSNENINVKFFVNEFTEKTMDLPIEYINFPKGSKVKIFPQKVALKCQVSREDFTKIDTTSFSLYIDYNNIKNQRAKVQIKKQPLFVEFVRIIPEKVEFIILK